MVNKSRPKGNEGFLLIEILIAGLIITASIAATMSLFRVGFQHLERVNISNQLSSKLAQSVSFLNTIDPEKEEGVEEMGDGVTLVWKSEILERTIPLVEAMDTTTPAIHELSLYKLDFQLIYNVVEKDYELHILIYKSRRSASGF